MKTIITTNLYDFSILLEEMEDSFDFEIFAISKINNTKSRITNVNFVISELIAPIITLESYETTIQVDRNSGNQIYLEAIRLFNDADWLKYLFTVLEDDKDAGEWSSLVDED